MEDEDRSQKPERRPLLSALWFRVVVVTFAAAVVGVLTIPPVLHWASVTEPMLRSETRENHGRLTIGASPVKPDSSMVMGLGVLTVAGFAWLTRGILLRWRRQCSVRAQLVATLAVPVDHRRTPRPDFSVAIAGQLLQEAESLLLRLQDLRSELETSAQGGLSALLRDVSSQDAQSSPQLQARPSAEQETVPAHSDAYAIVQPNTSGINRLGSR